MIVTSRGSLLKRFALPDYIEPVFLLGLRGGLHTYQEPVAASESIDPVVDFMYRSQTGDGALNFNLGFSDFFRTGSM